MQRKAKRRESGRGRAEHHAPNSLARPEPGYPPLLDTIVGLLQDPAARESLRRQLIDGTAAAIEPVLYTLAYDGPHEAKGNPIRWITLEQMKQEWAAEVAEQRRRATERKGRNAQ
jgi:hypothetical protein